MSTTIDSRVVEMRFDNKHFESNVSNTMSTLDKLKAKLGFKGATQGLENVSTAAKKVDLSSVSNAADTVGLRFNAMYTIADQALRNITNSAMQAGKNIISALTIDPVKTGLQEYETKIGAIQVIKANTRGKYASDEEQMAAIEKTLSDMNDYADRTIYNYTQMTNNLGKFVNQGLGLEEAANAVMGLANVAGASGASAEDMARATYQMSQAMGSVIRMQDWRSLMTANMAGQELKNVLMDFARVEGVDIDSMIADKGTFEKTLEEGWLSGELFTKAMNVYSDAYSEAELAAMGFNETQIANFKSLAETARVATTEVKTASQLWDVLKETAQSGWTQTWEIIVGDFDAAKDMFTGLQVYFSNIINKFSDARNRVLEIALNFTKPWKELSAKLSKVADVVSDVTAPVTKVGEIVSSIGDKFKNTTEAVEYYQKIVSSVWRGNWKRSDTGRYQLLEQAGYDHRVVQDLVNLGSRHKITIEDIERSHAKFGLTMTTTTEETENLTNAVSELSDEQLTNAGLTDDEISLYRALQEEAAKSGKSVSQLADEMSKTTGRDLLIESFKNMWSVIDGIAKALKGAWVDIFNPPGLEVMGIRLYGLLDRFKKFTESLRLTDKETGELNETGKKFQRIFKGVFAIVDIVATVLGGAFKIAFKIATEVLGYFGVGVLDVLAWVGDLAVKIRDWFDSLFDISGILDVIVPLISKAVDAVKAWFKAFKESDAMKGVIDYIKNLGQSIRDWWNDLANADDIPKKLAEGIVNFFKNIPKIIKTIFSGIWKAVISGFGIFDFGSGSGILGKITGAFSIVGNTIVELGKLILEKINGFLTKHGFKEISLDAVSGLVVGFKEGAANAWNAAVEMVKTLVEKVKNFLGIHSPSTVMIAIGGFLIAGLVKGISDGSFNLWDAITGIGTDLINLIKTIFGKIVEFVQNMNLGTVLVAGFGVGLLLVINKIADAIQAFSGIGQMFEGLGDMFEDFGKAAKTKALGKLITSIAIAIGVLAASLFLISKIEPDRLWSSVGALATLIGVFAALVAVIIILESTIGKAADKSGGGATGKLALMLLGISGAILMIAIAANMIAKMNPEQAEQAFKGLAGIVGAIVILMAAFGLILKGGVANNIDKAGGTLIKISIAMMLLVMVAKSIAKMPVENLKKGLTGMTGFVGIIALLMLATKLVGNNADKIGGTMLKISIAMYLLIAVAKSIAKMPTEDLKKGLAGMLGFVAIIAALMLISRLAGNDVDKVGGALWGIAAAMLVMGLIVKIMGSMDSEKMTKGLVATGVLAAIIAGLMLATKLAGGPDQVKAIGTAMLSIAGAIAIMALVVTLLGLVDVKTMAKGMVAIGLLSGMVTMMIWAMKDAKQCTGSLIMLAVIIALLTGAIVGLSFIDPTALASATLALSAVMGMFALMIASTKNSKNTKEMLRTMIVMAGIVAVLAGLVVLLAHVPAETALPNTVALSLLMLSFASALFIMGKAGRISTTVSKQLLPMMAVVAGLAVILGVLGALNVEASIPTAIAIGVLLNAMAAALLIASLAGPNATNAASAMFIMAGAVIGVGVILGLLAKFDIEPSIETALAMSVLLLAMSAACVLVSRVPAAAAIQGAIGLAAFIGIMAAVVAAAGGLSKIPGFNGLLADGGETLALIGNALGKFVGSIVAGFAGELLTLLPVLGTCLSQFIVNATPFIEGVKMVDLSVLEGVGILSAAILALTVADLVAGVASFLQGGSSFAQLGTDLSAFMINALPFITTAMLITPDMLSGVRALADTILILTGAQLLEGLASFITGGSSLESFAQQLPILGAGIAAFAASLGEFTPEQMATITFAVGAIKALAKASAEIPNTGGLVAAIVGENDLGTFAAQFPVLGTGLKDFIANIGTFTEAEITTVNCAAQAIKTLAQASSEIPNTGGMLAAIVGENDLGTFAAQFPVLGTGLRGFIDNIGTFSDAEMTTINCAADAIKVLAEASSQIPNTGGWLAEIVGDNPLDKFALAFPELGTGIRGFIDNIGTFTEAEMATVTCAANAIKSLAEASSQIPNTGGWLAEIVGDNTLEDFATALPNVGTGIGGFVTELGTFTDTQVNTVTAAVAAVQALTGLANADLKGASKNLGNFGDEVIDFASDLSSFCTSMPSSSSMNSAVGNLNKLLDAVKSIGNANSGALSTFATNLKKIGEDAVAKFVGAFTSKSAKTDLKSAATDLADEAVSGASSKKSGKDSMESAGNDLGQGLVNGINAKWQAVYDAGFALGQAAVLGEKAGQESDSPSKLTIQAGKWLGEGLVIGMEQMGKKVYSAGHELGDTAAGTLSNTISNISKMISTDIDAQPTIRPVLDLSDVQSGASALSSMLDMDSTVGVRANIGAISSMMAVRSQNGANADVVSAIDKLNKRMDNLGNTTYQINGITYDDGSNITDAVATLVRAAKIERRV